MDILYKYIKHVYLHVHVYLLHSEYVFIIEHSFFYSRLGIHTEKYPLLFILIEVSPSV